MLIEWFERVRGVGVMIGWVERVCKKSGLIIGWAIITILVFPILLFFVVRFPWSRWIDHWRGRWSRG